MARQPTKAADNVFCRARLRAAMVDDRLGSRAGAAEVLGMSEDTIKRAELGLDKCMPAETAVLMADAYNAPQLLNYYCLHMCPIGEQLPLSEEEVGIDRVTVRLLKRLRTSKLRDIKDKLLDIAEDGEVSRDEIDDLVDVNGYLHELSRVVNELKIITDSIIGGCNNGKADGISR